MRIKQPTSNEPLLNIEHFLDIINDRAEICLREGHEFLSVIYVSSYVFSDLVRVHGKELSKVFCGLSQRYGPYMVCLIRTTKLPGFRHHKRFLDNVRRCCYVLVYDKKADFCNHAKFLVWIHVCLSEDVVYRSHYYGSTNFTVPGLAYGRRGKGNYEEYYYKRSPQIHYLNYLATHQRGALRGILYYLKDVHNILEDQYRINIDKSYVRHLVQGHQDYLNKVIKEIETVLRGATVFDFYVAYVDGLYAYLVTLAFLYQLPGKRLTNELAERLSQIMPPPSPLMLETMMINGGGREVERLISELYSKERLKDELNSVANVLREARSGISEYLDLIERYGDMHQFIHDYGDRAEREFQTYVMSRTPRSLMLLEKIFTRIRRWYPL